MSQRDARNTKVRTLFSADTCPRCGFETDCDVCGGCGGKRLDIEMKEPAPDWFINREPWQQREIQRCWRASGKQVAK